MDEHHGEGWVDGAASTAPQQDADTLAYCPPATGEVVCTGLTAHRIGLGPLIIERARECKQMDPMKAPPLWLLVVVQFAVAKTGAVAWRNARPCTRNR